MASRSFERFAIAVRVSRRATRQAVHQYAHTFRMAAFTCGRKRCVQLSLWRYAGLRSGRGRACGHMSHVAV
eukprot:363149-Chlamydomonas_euryale.AAC.3